MSRCDEGGALTRFIRTLVAYLLGMTALAPGAVAQEPPLPEPVRVITNIRGDLYRVQDRDHVTVFLVTAEGIVLADPLNVELARWLKGELATRFPNRPVQYVVHSHHAFDHAGGAGVFDDTADIIGHDDFDRERNRAASVMPDSLLDLDWNANGILERFEIAGTPRGATLAAFDRDGNGDVTLIELYDAVSLVETTYGVRRTLTLGGTTVELVHPGRAYAAEMTVLYFPAEHVVFAADYPPLSSQPFSLVSSNPKEVLESVRTVESLDFDTFVSGHGEVGTKTDVTHLRQYLEELVPGVIAGLKARLTIDQLQTSLTLDQHQQSVTSAQRKVNITEAFGALRVVTIGAYGAVVAKGSQRNFSCSLGGPTCELTGGPTAGVAAGVSVSTQHVAGSVELSAGRQLTGIRGSATTWEDRDTSLSFLGRHDFHLNGTMTVGIAGGVSRVSEATRVQRYELAHVVFGPTIGVDVVASVGRGIGIVFPVRVTHANHRTISSDRSTPGYWRFHAGVGLLVPVFQHVY